MKILAETTKEGLIKPIRKIKLPLGIRFSLIIEEVPKTTWAQLQSVSQKTFGIMKAEDWTLLRKKFNQNF